MQFEIRISNPTLSSQVSILNLNQELNFYLQNWEIRKPRVVEIERRMKAVVEAEHNFSGWNPNSDEVKLLKWLMDFWLLVP
ncbi:hypothetical protein MKW98_026096 [Papaver atlanticum]|uniref:Uncharacterized protein n=1 Tax=Papaver atlanticum TaxID=357466 RepID=A0AAD4RZF7_9MAGN|nr:hypothetical protein MKW98_026096 [Papaver atlanticum]